jgi:hypothetical protein
MDWRRLPILLAGALAGAAGLAWVFSFCYLHDWYFIFIVPLVGGMILAGAITICRPECFYHRIGAQHQNQLWMVRLMVHTEQGLRELLLGVAHVRWTPMTNDGRRLVAEEMCQRIHRLRIAASRGA